MKAIQLTNSNQVALVDDADYSEVCKHKWYRWTDGKRVYARRTNDDIYLHHFLLGEYTYLVINHKNWDGLDNQRSNLEKVTNSYNVFHGRHVPGKSGERNIHWHKQRGRWHVQFTINYQKISGGMYDRLEDAVKARDRLVKEFWK